MTFKEERGPWEWQQTVTKFKEALDPPSWFARRTVGIPHTNGTKIHRIMEIGPQVMGGKNEQTGEDSFFPRIDFETRFPERLHRIMEPGVASLDEAQRAAEKLWDWAVENLLDAEGNGKP